jgi:ADP-ribosylation factor GTPase-activating protein 2/3
MLFMEQGSSRLNVLPSSPVAASQPLNPSDDFPGSKLADAPEENINGKHEPVVANPSKEPTHSSKPLLIPLMSVL